MTYRSAVKCGEERRCNANATACWVRRRVAFPVQPIHVQNPRSATNGNGKFPLPTDRFCKDSSPGMTPLRPAWESCMCARMCSRSTPSLTEIISLKDSCSQGAVSRSEGRAGAKYERWPDHPGHVRLAEPPPDIRTVHSRLGNQTYTVFSPAACGQMPLLSGNRYMSVGAADSQVEIPPETPSC